MTQNPGPRTLHLAKDLDLPLEAVTRRLAILAMSGAGKSNTAVVMAEAMFDAGIPWVSIDPKGDWWGIRSSKSGKGPGLAIPIFGGLHGDLKLEPGAGRLIADLVVDQRLTCVLDVSEFDTRQAMWQFLADFGETLLRRNRQALHLFLEECDEYLPQKTSEKGNLLRCLGVWQRVVKRGRFRGIGTTQITQRSASLNKDTLYMAEALIAMRVTGKGDRDAIKGWVEHHNAAAEIVASLSTLQDGEAWLSSPAWLRETKRVQFNRRRTFDSGSTPVLLESTAPAATLADVDLDALRTKMADSLEKQKADDPAELRKQIATLKGEIASLSRRKPEAPKQDTVKVVEKAVLTAGDRELLTKVATSIETTEKHAREGLAAAGSRAEQKTQTAVAEYLNTTRNVALELAQELEKVLGRVGVQKILSKLSALSPEPSAPNTHAPIATGSRTTPAASQGRRVAPAAATSRPASLPPSARAAEGLTEPQQVILDTVAVLNVRGITADRDTVARWIGIHPNGGSYGTNLGRLRSEGYLEGFTLTEKGAAAARAQATGQEAALAALEGEPKRQIIRTLVEAGAALSREELAGKLGIHPNGGSYGTNLGWLRTMGLITKSGPITTTEGLFR